MANSNSNLEAPKNQNMRETNQHKSTRKLVSFSAFSTAVLLLIFSLLAVNAAAASPDSQIQCSKKCLSLNCDNMGIRYGKYCGVGHSGCVGEKPCDDLDACCQIHDDCVEKRGMTNVKCHEKFKRCIKKVQKSGKAGFSKDCPYDVAVPTMVQGMDLAIMMSQLAGPKLEL